MKMKTHISEFCTEFSEALFPLSESLSDAVRKLDEVGEESVASLRTSFSNVRHRVEALVNKIQGQEAYVLLFGPLKSGKSTLINAISANYVSEVTSLPAYPCMVNLKYGETPSYSVIRYSGKKEQVETPDDLKTLLELSHRTLSERIRAIEDFGEDFDPAVHLPSAVRRVQVELPAENLRESGTVLVDTPGLYSKMKFGYDAMTQDFRDSAAAAVFVVKTDNLFLEQVFDDFNDLLDQFSRVFVVVNVDSGKQDLRPDGTLSPSLESSDPDQIVKAFEALTMSAPLRRAAESGRLHLYPIDLCSAAARRLGSDDRPAEPDAKEPDRFDRFLNDLLEYLNSTDYLLEFMADTTRQSETLTREIVKACESEPAVAIRRGQAEVRRRIDAINRTHASVNRMRNQDWDARFVELRDARREERAVVLEKLRGTFQEQAAHAVETWFSCDESLAALRDKRVGPLIHEAVTSYRDQARNCLESLGEVPMMGLSLPADVAADVKSVDLNLDAVGGWVLCELPAAEVEEVAIQLPFDRVPVRRRVLDKLLFRSPAVLRRKLFGPAGLLDHPVLPRAKEKQLGPEARAAMMEDAEAECNRQLDRAEEADGERRLKAFADACMKRIESEVTGLERELTRNKNEAACTAEKLDRLDATFRQLGEVAGSVLATVGRLEEKHRPYVQNLVEASEVLEPAGAPVPSHDRTPDISSRDGEEMIIPAGAETPTADSQG